MFLVYVLAAYVFGICGFCICFWYMWILHMFLVYVESKLCYLSCDHVECSHWSLEGAALIMWSCILLARKSMQLARGTNAMARGTSVIGHGVTGSGESISWIPLGPLTAYAVWGKLNKQKNTNTKHQNNTGKCQNQVENEAGEARDPF